MFSLESEVSSDTADMVVHALKNESFAAAEALNADFF